MLNLPIYSNKKLLLAFEHGVILSKVARDMGMELTPELIERAEDILIKEFRKNNPQRLAINMYVTLLAIFQTK